jgi:hypothetical protein
MRHFKNFMILVMTLSAITFTSCSSDDDGGGDPGPGGAASGVLVAKVDGANYQSLEISSSATVANGGQNLIIIATNSDGNAFSFTIIGYDGPGTYPLGGDLNIFNSASYTETNVDINNPQNSTTEIWQAPYSDEVVGELRVTEETDTKVIGNFDFTCKNVGGDQSIKTIIDGSFNLGKQVID